MSQRSTHHELPTATPGTPARRNADPSSSRMFASYLSEIEALLDEERWDAALSEAADLPALTVALCSPDLRCSVERVQGWCEQWLRPAGAERDAQGADFERLSRSILERALPPAVAETVPLPALRRLQRSRYVRTPPRGFPFVPAGRLTVQQASAAELCAALIDAARRWYARSACHDEVVQMNLARLAVLR